MIGIPLVFIVALAFMWFDFLDAMHYMKKCMAERNDTSAASSSPSDCLHQFLTEPADDLSQTPLSTASWPWVDLALSILYSAGVSLP